MDAKKHTRASHPIQSTSTQNKLKCIKSTVERLHYEVEDLNKVKNELTELLKYLDSEATELSHLTNVAFMAAVATTKSMEELAASLEKQRP